MKLGHHTSAQVLAGIALGAAVALGWLLLWVGLDSLLESVGLRAVGENLVSIGAPRFVGRGVRDTGNELDSVLDHVTRTVLTAWKEKGVAGVKGIDYRLLISNRNKES